MPSDECRRPTQVTDNELNDQSPQISGRNVVWSGSDGNDTEIFIFSPPPVPGLTGYALWLLAGLIGVIALMVHPPQQLR